MLESRKRSIPAMRKERDWILRKRPGGKDYDTGWDDLVVTFKAWTCQDASPN
jgi:hypothetical protein